MSTPRCSEHEQPPESTPRSVGDDVKTVRGSAKLPRTGCCRSNGFTGQRYEPLFAAWSPLPRPLAAPRVSARATAERTTAAHAMRRGMLPEMSV